MINADYPSGGVNLEYCRATKQCAGSRLCYYVPPGASLLHRCNSTANRCFCRYGSISHCETSKDCSIGERCFIFKDNNQEVPAKHCWACRIQRTEVVEYADNDPSSCNDVWLGGYTGDICHFDYFNCADTRRCVQFLEDGTYVRCPLKSEPCFCWPKKLTSCTSSAQCENRERCATSKEGVTACYSCGRVDADDTFTVVDSNAVCSRPSPISSLDPQYRPSPTSGVLHSPEPTTKSLDIRPTSRPPLHRPCISVAHLSEFSNRDLVFSGHIRAVVLCDGHHSCATAGHMVVFRNRIMTMASYCAEYATCSSRTAWVNNPRMRQALRVASHSKGLYFTALSARYETKVEELFLKLVISSGI